MIWHIVRFDFSSTDAPTRADLEDRLRALASLDCVGFLRLGRDLDVPAVTGLITGFDSADDLEAYRTHPDHVPVVDAIRAAGVGVTRVDLETDDDVAVLA